MISSSRCPIRSGDRSAVSPAAWFVVTRDLRSPTGAGSRPSSVLVAVGPSSLARGVERQLLTESHGSGSLNAGPCGGSGCFVDARLRHLCGACDTAGGEPRGGPGKDNRGGGRPPGGGRAPPPAPPHRRPGGRGPWGGPPP